MLRECMSGANVVPHMQVCCVIVLTGLSGVGMGQFGNFGLCVSVCKFENSWRCIHICTRVSGGCLTMGMCANAMVHGGVCGCAPYVCMGVSVCTCVLGKACLARHWGSVLELDPCWAHSENYPLTRPNLGLCPMTHPIPWGRHSEET